MMEPERISVMVVSLNVVHGNGIKTDEYTSTAAAGFHHPVFGRNVMFSLGY